MIKNSNGKEIVLTNLYRYFDRTDVLDYLKKKFPNDVNLLFSPQEVEHYSQNPENKLYCFSMTHDRTNSRLIEMCKHLMTKWSSEDLGITIEELPDGATSYAIINLSGSRDTYITNLNLRPI